MARTGARARALAPASPAASSAQHCRWGSATTRCGRRAAAQHYVEAYVNEHGQRWLYRAWTEWMAARDWAELKATHSPPPTGAV